MTRDAWTPERRRSDRRVIPFPLPARIEGSDARAIVCELGEGGMVVESLAPLAAGTSVRVTLGTAPDAVGPIEGHVIHSRLILGRHAGDAPVYLAGVAFRRVTSEEAGRLAAWLSSAAPHATRRI